MPATGHACRAHDESNVANIGITHIERRLWFGYRLRQRDYSVTPLAAPALAHLAEQTLVGGDKAAIVRLGQRNVKAVIRGMVQLDRN